MKSQTDIIWSAILNIMQLSHFCSGVCLCSCMKSITSHMIFPSVFFFFSLLSSLLSLPVITSYHSLILSHFQSVSSPLHSHLSILIQNNFPRPVFSCLHLSNLITLLSYQKPFSLNFLTWYLSLFCSLCITFLSFINHFFFFFIFLSLSLLSDVELPLAYLHSDG